MSLISKQVAVVGQSSHLEVSKQSFVAPAVINQLGYLTGRFKQIVGYVSFKNSGKWTYALDLTTGKPLEMPPNTLPVIVYTSPLDSITPENDNNRFYYGFANTLDIQDPANEFLNSDWWTSYNFNNSTAESALQYMSIPGKNKFCAASFKGFKYVVFENRDFPTYLPTSGVMKIIIEYM